MPDSDDRAEHGDEGKGRSPTSVEVTLDLSDASQRLESMYEEKERERAESRSLAMIPRAIRDELASLRCEVEKLKEKLAEVEPKARWWRHYPNSELQSLTFKKVSEFEKAVAVLWDDPFFRGMPWDTPDGMTIFVPCEAVTALEKHNLKFKAKDVLVHKDMSREKLAQARREMYGR